MIHEPLVLREEYFGVTKEIIAKMRDNALLDQNKLVVSICGESACGKSTTAKCLQFELDKLGIASVILHQDNYYKLPPSDNHAKRKVDISWVGPKEVKLDLLQNHINAFRNNTDSLTLPVVDYKKNHFFDIEVEVKDKTVIIVEGVYAFLLQNCDFNIFMSRTYIETKEKRKERIREVYDPFIEKVLDVEHQLIAPLKLKADLIVDKFYKVSENKHD